VNSSRGAANPTAVQPASNPSTPLASLDITHLSVVPAYLKVRGTATISCGFATLGGAAVSSSVLAWNAAHSASDAAAPLFALCS
jgi:hypothetical protein